MITQSQDIETFGRLCYSNISTREWLCTLWNQHLSSWSLPDLEYHRPLEIHNYLNHGNQTTAPHPKKTNQLTIMEKVLLNDRISQKWCWWYTRTSIHIMIVAFTTFRLFSHSGLLQVSVGVGELSIITKRILHSIHIDCPHSVLNSKCLEKEPKREVQESQYFSRSTLRPSSHYPAGQCVLNNVKNKN